jgi:FixJ family two-component response regulator
MPATPYGEGKEVLPGYSAPFIVITAFPDEGVRARAMNAGAIGFLAKSCKASNLIVFLDAALAAQRRDIGV